MSFSVTQAHIDQFQLEGFLAIDAFVDPALAKQVAERFAPLFRGEFETTVPPDEWRWAQGRDPDDVTRMIWNGWKSDLTVAALALSEKVGAWCAQLAGWDGARLNQDGCLWKPPGAVGLAYHQDEPYNRWVDPCAIATCWVALDPIASDSGGIEYARGSHTWGVGAMPDDFHKPRDHRAGVEAAARQAQRELDIVVPTVPLGGATFHHGLLWHGSGPNNTNQHRRILAIHCMRDDAQYHAREFAYAQGRYRRLDSTHMDESHYPILWSVGNTRSAIIEMHMARPTRSYKSHAFAKAPGKPTAP